MSITVLEATKLPSFRNFRLIAGHRGLDNSIETVGILDYEFITKIEGQFVKGEFVISSLLFAKDNPHYILESVKSLIEDGVSALAIKNIYYNDLPNEVIHYANEKSFPIFIFDNSVFFEQIITEVMDRIKFVDNYELLEAKVDILMNQSLNRSIVREIAYEINSSFKEHFFVLYCREKKFIGNTKTISILEALKRNKSIPLYSSAFQFRDGLLIIYTDETLEKQNLNGIVNNLIENMGIKAVDYEIGVSNEHKNLNELDNGVKESIFAQKACKFSNKRLCHFSSIGVYSILMPYLDETWIRSFHHTIILPIEAYDEKYSTELLNTAIKYIENDGRIDETANALFLHKNTIRYRINKIKELLHMESLEGSFYEQLSIGVKLHMIYHS